VFKKKSFKIATYNIHRCIGIDDKYNPQRILRVIHELDADIIGIQEIDSHSITEEGHQLGFIIKGTDYDFVAGPTMFRPDAHYGNVLLTKHTVLKVRNIDLSVPGFEPRAAIDVDLSINGLTYRVITTHLGLKYRERLFQIKHLSKKLQDNPQERTIVLGDFNEWWPIMGTTRILKRSVTKISAAGTFPAHRPLFKLDEIYTTIPKCVLGAHVHRSQMAQQASDHLPVLAEIEF
jgi:endonuclease/exonuclease/phosphatase family metal-dependent hydrolase